MKGKCTIWQGGTSGEYGTVYDARLKKTIGAHRQAYAAAHGAIPAGMVVRHRCGNKLCVNVDHLFLAGGTAWTRAQGEAHYRAKLTRLQVRHIRRLIAKGDLSDREIASRYDVTHSAIWAIRKGRTWKHV